MVGKPSETLNVKNNSEGFLHNYSSEDFSKTSQTQKQETDSNYSENPGKVLHHYGSDAQGNPELQSIFLHR